MKNFLLTILAVFAMPLAVTSSAFAQDASKQAAEDKVEVKKPSLTYYFIDQ